MSVVTWAAARYRRRAAAGPQGAQPDAKPPMVPAVVPVAVKPSVPVAAVPEGGDA